jgi:hypothetical protein
MVDIETFLTTPYVMVDEFCKMQLPGLSILLLCGCWSFT